MAEASARIPANMLFVWLDKCSEDFEGLRRNYCNKTSTNPDNWKFYDNEAKCSHFIRQADSKQSIIFISSGRLSVNLIPDLNNLPQIHSIYIYCHKKDKYESFKTTYNKVREIFDNPIQLEDHIYCNLNEEAGQSECDISTRTNISPMPNMGGNSITLSL